MTRVVAITGASAGIGRATALRLAKDGASLILCARRRELLKATAEDVIRNGGQALPIVADVTSEADMNDLVSRGVERFGRLDVMMCNAGFGLYGALDQIPADKMRQVINVNYVGSYLAIRAALPVFRRQGSGHILIISSIVGQRGIPYMGAYAATKSAQVGMAECLRAELQGTGIHVSIVFPVSTDTEFFAVMKQASGFATRALGPRQSADTVANAIAKAIERPRPEVYPYPRARGLVLFNAIAPGWCDRLVQRWGRRPV
jgi:short-subunit dehydrogenase